MTDLNELKAQLDRAVEELNRHKLALESLPEFKAVKDAEGLVIDIQSQIITEGERLEAERLGKVKEEILQAGFEVRHGHTTSASNHHRRTSEDGEPWTYLIVLSSRPKVSHISEWSRDITIECEGEGFEADWILGHGETEEEAWEDAASTWGDKDYRALALAGL
jgi:hypothetical protein